MFLNWPFSTISQRRIIITVLHDGACILEKISGEVGKKKPYLEIAEKELSLSLKQPLQKKG